jgi:hypothetical protein
VTPHRFDLIAAALGVIAIALGLLVATDSIDNIDADAGWWFAVAALVLGIALVPWTRRPPARTEAGSVDGSVADAFDGPDDAAPTAVAED